MRTLVFAAAASLCVLGACTPEPADQTGNAMPATNDTAIDTVSNDMTGNAMASAALPTDAQGFMTAAGASDLYEIQSSRLAIDKSQNPSVKEFADTMIADHTRTTQAVADAAKKAGLSAPTPEMTPDQQQQVETLTSLTGHDFDVAYAEQQLPAHQKALLLMTNYAQNGDTPALREAARSAIPTIEHHLASLKQMTGLDR